jgi:GNAT superfamily N-acetyltransferase
MALWTRESLARLVICDRRKLDCPANGGSVAFMTVGGRAELSWRMLADADLPAVTDLARECLSADGGQPFAASAGYLSECYLGGAQTRAGFSNTRLVCVSSIRAAEAVVTTGMVHPAWRRRGIGDYGFDWARDRAGGRGRMSCSLLRGQSCRRRTLASRQRRQSGC